MKSCNYAFVTVCALVATICATDSVLAQGCPGSPTQSHGPDVMVSDLTGPGNYGTLSGLTAATFGADACNLGDQQVNWFACPATTHPVFGGNIYKWYIGAGTTRFEQLGQSWLKHGFGADQEQDCCANCQPGPFTRLGLGCADAYVEWQAADQTALGPKNMVNAHTGIYSSVMCTTHPIGGNTGLCEVFDAELSPSAGGPGANVRYFAQFQYLTADDAAAHNQNNNASCREMALSGTPGNHTFFFPVGNITHQMVPAIRMWKLIDSGVVETDVNTTEDDGFPGLVIMAARVTDIGNGFWHYEYAVNNLNSDRSIGAFRVPCSQYATIQNIGFRDVAYRGGDGIGGVNYDGTDWPGTVGADGAITWATTPFATNQNANAIRWGTLYNFRFDADLPPDNAATVVLTEFKVTTTVTATSIAPVTINCTKGDLNNDGLVDAADIATFTSILISGNGTPAQKCAGDVQSPPDGKVNESDIDGLVTCLLSGGCP